MELCLMLQRSKRKLGCQFSSRQQSNPEGYRGVIRALNVDCYYITLSFFCVRFFVMIWILCIACSLTLLLTPLLPSHLVYSNNLILSRPLLYAYYLINHNYDHLTTHNPASFSTHVPHTLSATRPKKCPPSSPPP